MPTWTLPAERTTADSTIVADLNKIRDILQLLGGNGISQPTSDIEALKALVDSGALSTGDIMMKAVLSTPAGWLKCDGSAVSRTTYATLYAAVTSSLGAVTISNGANATITLAAGTWTEGQCIEFTTTGGLPTGLSINTNYYVHVTGTASIANVSTTRVLLDAGTYVTTSSAGSGVHTARYCPYGISTITNFLLPDYQARVPKGVGAATIRGNAKTAPAFGGDEEDQGQGHWHTFRYYNGAADASWGAANALSAVAAGGPGLGRNSGADSNQNISVTALIANSTDGTPRTGLTTRENTLGTNFYIKYE